MQRHTLTALALALALPLAGCGGGGGGNSDATFTAAPPAPPQLGTYGGGVAADPASLLLTSNGGVITFACGYSATLTQPLTVNDGHFDAAATASPLGPVPVSPPSQMGSVPPNPPAARPVRLVGSARGNTLTVTVQEAGFTDSTYTLVLGQQAPAFTGGCPA